MRTITIKGMGNAVKDPDLVIFRIFISILKEEFDDALDSMNELVSNLKISLKEIGFEESDLKTIRMGINPEYDFQGKGIINKEYEKVFIGFRINHDLGLEFDLDNERISDVFDCLKEFDNELKFKLVFSVKDKEAMKKEVLINATKNAKFNAETLAEASSSKLGDLLKIEYDWDNSIKTIRSFDSSTEFDFDSYEIPSGSDLFRSKNTNLTPKEIKISDSATFVWELIN